MAFWHKHGVFYNDVNGCSFYETDFLMGFVVTENKSFFIRFSGMSVLCIKETFDWKDPYILH